tara:strand:+ start:2328 stop:2684 length:357 start_codon:yes stop_codon:yes gene_type:complete
MNNVYIGIIQLRVMGDIYDSTWHPEDDLPSWVFDYDVCDNCEGAVDSKHDYQEYGIKICTCEDCEICGECTNEENDWVIVNIPSDLSKKTPPKRIILCYSCSGLIYEAVEGNIYSGGE